MFPIWRRIFIFLLSLAVVNTVSQLCLSASIVSCVQITDWDTPTMPVILDTNEYWKLKISLFTAYGILCHMVFAKSYVSNKNVLFFEPKIVIFITKILCLFKCILLLSFSYLHTSFFLYIYFTVLHILISLCITYTRVPNVCIVFCSTVFSVTEPLYVPASLLGYPNE